MVQVATRRIEREQQSREANRRAILDAALKLFVEEGFPQVSLRKIASRAEYSPAAIYAYFPSKDEIFFALAEEGFRLLGATEVCSATSDDPLADVKATMWRLYQFSREYPEYFALVFLDRSVPRIGREYERFAFIAEMKDRIHAQVQRCIDLGQLPASVSAGVALRLLSASVLGLAALRLSNRLSPGEDADALVLDAIDTTVAGLQAGAAHRAFVPGSPCCGPSAATGAGEPERHDGPHGDVAAFTE